METVTSLQHPTARFSHSAKAVPPPRAEARVLGAGGSGEGRCTVPLAPPSHRLQRTVTFPAGILGISPFFQQPLIGLNLFSHPVWRRCLDADGAEAGIPLCFPPTQRTKPLWLCCTSSRRGRSAVDWDVVYHLGVLHPANAQKAKLHLLAVFAVQKSLQNPGSFCKSSRRKLGANSKSGEKSGVREQR